MADSWHACQSSPLAVDAAPDTGPDDRAGACPGAGGLRPHGLPGYRIAGGGGGPVYAERGPAGGYALLDGYRTRLTGLSEDEAESLFLTGVPAVAAELGLGSVLAAAELKLLASLSPESAGRAGRIRERFHLDAPGWFHQAEPVASAGGGGRTGLEREALRVRYRRWGAEVDRDLDPLGLVLKSGTWYLVAWPTEAGRRGGGKAGRTDGTQGWGGADVSGLADFSVGDVAWAGEAARGVRSGGVLAGMAGGVCGPRLHAGSRSAGGAVGNAVLAAGAADGDVGKARVAARAAGRRWLANDNAGVRVGLPRDARSPPRWAGSGGDLAAGGEEKDGGDGAGGGGVVWECDWEGFVTPRDPGG